MPHHKSTGSSSAIVLDMLHSRKPSTGLASSSTRSSAAAAPGMDGWIPLDQQPQKSPNTPSAAGDYAHQDNPFQWQIQKEASDRRRKRLVVRTLVATLLAALLLWLVTRPSKTAKDVKSYASSRLGQLKSAFALSDNLVCNPFDQTGFLNWSDSNPRTAQWVTYPASEEEEACPSAPDYFARIADAFTDDPQAKEPGPAQFKAQQAAEADVAFLKGKTVLLMGDSVDRNALFHMADLAHAGVWPSNYLDASANTPPEGWDVRGVPHVLDQWQLGLRVYNNFFYGMDDKDDFSTATDWHAPGQFEQRLEELFKPFMNQLNKTPDLISLHTGMWDLALFGRQDTRRQVDTSTPIDEQRVRWWFKRMGLTIKAVQEAWPGVPIWIRVIHRVGELPSLSSGDYTHGVQDDPSKVQNFFTDLRIKQFQEMQKSVARRHCLPYWDFSKTWEGYQHLQDKVHPEPLPGGLAYGYPLLHALKMESIGRENWLKKPCQEDFEP